MKTPTKQLQFHGKVALITGGTAGIGAATVKRISELGANVLFTGRHVENAQKIIRDTERNPGEVVFVQADLSAPEEVRKIIPLVVSSFGRLDFAFNNAGTFGSMEALAEQSEENFDQVFALNVKALFLLLQSELTLMLDQRSGGSIVNTASVNGMVAATVSTEFV
jgi:NAD(P)-dependent dehydrogenase (short-subunit alcohol dehydrogenase family)